MTVVAAGLTAGCASGSLPTPVSPQGARDRRATAAPATTVVPVSSTRTPASTSAPAPAVLSGLVQVDAGDYFFYPDVVTVTVGTMVRWTHVGGTGHDVTAVDGSWGTALIPASSFYEYKFTKPGIYEYLCYLHRPGMTGTVVVVKP